MLNYQHPLYHTMENNANGSDFSLSLTPVFAPKTDFFRDFVK